MFGPLASGLTPAALRSLRVRMPTLKGAAVWAVSTSFMVCGLPCLIWRVSGIALLDSGFAGQTPGQFLGLDVFSLDLALGQLFRGIIALVFRRQQFGDFAHHNVAEFVQVQPPPGF